MSDTELPAPHGTTEERSGLFEAALRGGPLAETPEVRFIPQFGGTNSFAAMPGGLTLGQPNFDKTPPSEHGFVIVGAIRFLPDEEILLGVHVREDAALMASWLAEMVKLANEGDQRFSKSNNLVKAFLVLVTGRLHARNKGFWKALANVDYGSRCTIDGEEAGPPIRIDRLFYAVHPDNTGIRSAQVTEFLNTLDKALGQGKLQGVNPWPDAGGVAPHTVRMPSAMKMDDIKAGVHEQGGQFAPDLIERFHVGLNYLSSKHFVILTGISGTGKTLLVKAYSRAVHGITDPKVKDPFLFVCPVRPDWTDPSGLTGYFDVVAGQYVVPPFLKALMTAKSRPDTPIFVCLDEMNLARVEYYLADVLSAMESGQDIPLHSHAAPVPGSTGTLIEPSIELPPNLFLIGTINIDETTHPVSDKVLDRAVLIDTSEVDIPAFVTRLKGADAKLVAAADVCSGILESVNGVLTPHRLGFGLRVAEEFVRYVEAATRLGGTATEVAIDHQLVQKVLVKLKGTDKQAKMLEALVPLFEKHPKAKALVEGLAADLESFGSFQVTR